MLRQIASLSAVALTAVPMVALNSTSAEAALVCRDQPINTTHLTGSKASRYFHYQPMKKSGLFGKCEKAGPVKKIKMLVPRLPKGVKRVGKSRWNQTDGCSGGGVSGRTLFHAACNAHDICYRTLGTSKYKCENMFLENMLKIAKHGPVGSRTKALAFVTAVGTAVRAHDAYASGQNFARSNYR